MRLSKERDPVGDRAEGPSHVDEVCGVGGEGPCAGTILNLAERGHVRLVGCVNHAKVPRLVVYKQMQIYRSPPGLNGRNVRSHDFGLRKHIGEVTMTGVSVHTVGDSHSQ